MDSSKTNKVALMWRGDPRAPDRPTHYETRLQPVINSLRGAGYAPEPIVYFDEQATIARDRLLACCAALVWINPLADGRDRSIVDDVLRDVAAHGVWVSAHPDVIAKIGVKTVLFHTQHLGWGSDVRLYETPADFALRFPAALGLGARVLKPNRGSDGQGILKVASVGPHDISVQHASSDEVQLMDVDALRDIVAPVFARAGGLIDQEAHPTDGGMVRCYVCGDRVIGFAIQRPRQAYPSPEQPAFAMNSAKEMWGPDHQPFSDLRASMEEDWIPRLLAAHALDRQDLPALWDADFLWRATISPGRSRFALCEINASCVSPFPDTAPDAILSAVQLCAYRQLHG